MENVFLNIKGSLFIVGGTMVENAVFPDKTALLKSMLRQIEWKVQIMDLLQRIRFFFFLFFISRNLI